MVSVFIILKYSIKSSALFIKEYRFMMILYEYMLHTAAHRTTVFKILQFAVMHA